jgi:hypothetical protein
MSQLPELQVVEIPESLRVGPEYGLALMKGSVSAPLGADPGAEPASLLIANMGFILV